MKWIKKFSYQWQMFAMLAVTLWAVIFSMADWQYINECKYRRQTITRQLNMVNDRIADAFERGTDLSPFITFMSNYFQNDELFENLRVSVYLNGRLHHRIGQVIRTTAPGITQAEREAVLKQYEADNYYFSAKEVNGRGGHLMIYMAVPKSAAIKALALPNRNIWYIVCGIGILLTIGAYYMTRYFGRNISILRSFAKRAATDPNFIPGMDYPNDELGDISRQIIHMYNERSKALLKLKREHKVTMHAMDEKSKLKRQLTNNINHELKTPIAVIKGYLDTIIENPDMDDASRTHFLTKAREHVNRIVALLTDLSAITRLEDGSNLINTEPINYHDVVYTASNDFDDSGLLGLMEFNYDIPLDCMVMGNYNLLSGMITNLTKNAVAYSRGSECGIRLVNEDDKWYTFAFYDNGRGVGEEHLPHLFDRFYRVDSGRSRKAGGTGLGLPIVQHTVEAHGGSIIVRNRHEGGLEFIFTLPRAH